MTTPFETEEVKQSELRVGDVVLQGGTTWVTIREIHAITDAQPEWERKLGSRAFVCDWTDDLGRPRKVVQYQGDDDYVVTRRKA